MNRFWLSLCWTAILYSAIAGQQQQADKPPLLRGEIRYLNGQVAQNIAIYLEEPDLDGATDEHGMFKMRLKAAWSTGKQVTLVLRDIPNYGVLFPKKGKITIQLKSEEKIEEIVIAETPFVQLMNNEAEFGKFLQEAIVAREKSRDQPEISSEFEVFRREAEKLNTTVKELLVFLDEWKKQAEKSEDLNKKALAALYEKHYADAIELWKEDLAHIDKQIAQAEAEADSLKRLKPIRYLNLGIAHAGRYEHTEAEKAFKKALELNPDLSNARILLANTYEFTGRLPGALRLLRIEAQRHVTATDSISLAVYSNVLIRIGSVYNTQGKPDSVLVYNRQALSIYRQLGRPEGIAIGLGNIGIVYATRGKLDSALVYYRQALSINRQLGHLEGIAAMLTNIGRVYETQGKLDSVLAYHHQALTSTANWDAPKVSPRGSPTSGLCIRARQHRDCVCHPAEAGFRPGLLSPGFKHPPATGKPRRYRQGAQQHRGCV